MSRLGQTIQSDSILDDASKDTWVTMNDPRSNTWETKIMSKVWADYTANIHAPWISTKYPWMEPGTPGHNPAITKWLTGPQGSVPWSPPGPPPWIYLDLPLGST